MKKVLLLALGLFASAGIFAQTGAAGYTVGDVATDFSLRNIDNTMVSMKGSFPDANGYIVIFTCNHCPYAIAYEDRIIALQDKYGPQGYPVIAINPNDPEVVPEDDFDQMIVRAQEKSFNFSYLFDENQSVFPAYGAKKTPHVYLLDQNLNVKYIGAIDDSPRNAEEVEVTYLENAIEAIKQGQAPNPSETKAIGCSIKVKS